VKVSTTAPGFWGITKNQIDNLIKSDARWFCILLGRQASVGYLLSGGQIVMRIATGALTLSRGDYKINRRADLHGSQRFESIETVIARML
jgi:hypothetical protein